MIDLLAAREMAEDGSVSLRWVPTTHMVADMLTKSMTPPVAVLKFLKEGAMSLKPTSEEQVEENHRADLCRGQRQRHKEKLREAKQEKKQGQ